MAGPNRINFPSLFCSCVGQAAILGSIMYGLADHQRERPGVRRSPAPLILKFEPLLGRDHPAKSVNGKELAIAALPPERRRAMPRAESRAAADSRDPGTPAPPSSTVGPNPGAGQGSTASAEDVSEYKRRLHEAVASRSRYPAEARRLNLSGVTHLAFTLDRSGRVLDSWVQDSSGSELLDNAAIEALDRAQPLPPIPAGLPSRLDFVIEIDLSVVRQGLTDLVPRK